jgi:hypothetical protein
VGKFFDLIASEKHVASIVGTGVGSANVYGSDQFTLRVR